MTLSGEQPRKDQPLSEDGCITNQLALRRVQQERGEGRRVRGVVHRCEWQLFRRHRHRELTSVRHALEGVGVGSACQE